MKAHWLKFIETCHFTPMNDFSTVDAQFHSCEQWIILVTRHEASHSLSSATAKTNNKRHNLLTDFMIHDDDE